MRDFLNPFTLPLSTVPKTMEHRKMTLWLALEDLEVPPQPPKPPHTPSSYTGKASTTEGRRWPMEVHRSSPWRTSGSRLGPSGSQRTNVAQHIKPNTQIPLLALSTCCRVALIHLVESLGLLQFLLAQRVSAELSDKPIGTVYLDTSMGVQCRMV